MTDARRRQIPDSPPPQRQPVPVTAYIAVGSNIDPLQNIPRALQYLQRRLRVTATSTFYETEPLGPDGKPDGDGTPRFLNGVWQVETTLAPQDLCDLLHQVEHALGRIRDGNRFAPRPIDLDLILYGAHTIDTPDLKLPHPDLTRPFVRHPLTELLRNSNEDTVPARTLLESTLRCQDAAPAVANSPGAANIQLTRHLETLLS